MDGEDNKLTKRAVFMRSCKEECKEAIKARIEGEIPDWLKGTLIRNGPGVKEIGQDKYLHLFDGLALLHQFTISNGEVYYKNKFLNSKAYQRVTRAKRIVVSEFGTHSFPDPCLSLFGRFMSLFTSEELTDNDAVNIYQISDSVYATTESAFVHRIDPKTLDTYERIDMSKCFAFHVQTAHPHVDADGTFYNIGSKFGMNGAYIIVKIPKPKENENPIDAFKQGEIVTKITPTDPMNPSYFHSFCLTKNYIVFIEQSVVISLRNLSFSSYTKKPFGDAMHWKPKLTTKFHVINKATGNIEHKFEANAMAFFHTINAYEEDDHIVCDICTYDDGNLVHALNLKEYNSVLTKAENGIPNLRDDEIGKCFLSEGRRYVMPLKVNIDDKDEKNLITLKNSKAEAHRKNNTIYLTPESLTTTGFSTAEMPRINYDYNGKKYRYFYGWAKTDNFQVQLMKHDIEEKSSKIWFESDFSPSEAVFIPRPNGESEDDGVVLSAVLDENNEKHGYLLVLDGKTFTVLAKAHFETPSAIPSDFHGHFIVA